jgi:uncharacterized protein (DUF608 family)
MSPKLKSLYSDLDKLNAMDNPPKYKVIQVTYAISQEKAKESLETQPDSKAPEDFGASMHSLKEVIKGVLKEYNRKNKPRP